MTGGLYTSVGKITRPQGVKGEVRILPFSSSPDALMDLKSDVVWAGLPESPESVRLTISGMRRHKGMLIAEFAELESAEEAERLRDATLYVRDEDLWDLQEDEFFVHQIKGLEVRDAQTKERLGVVADILENPGHDHLLIELPERRVMLPMVREFVKKIDTHEGAVFVLLPEGLPDFS